MSLPPLRHCARRAAGQRERGNSRPCRAGHARGRSNSQARAHRRADGRSPLAILFGSIAGDQPASRVVAGAVASLASGVGRTPAISCEAVRPCSPTPGFVSFIALFAGRTSPPRRHAIFPYTPIAHEMEPKPAAAALGDATCTLHLRAPEAVVQARDPLSFRSGLAGSYGVRLRSLRLARRRPSFAPATLALEASPSQNAARFCEPLAKPGARSGDPEGPSRSRHPQ